MLGEADASAEEDKALFLYEFKHNVHKRGDSEFKSPSNKGTPEVEREERKPRRRERKLN